MIARKDNLAVARLVRLAEIGERTVLYIQAARVAEELRAKRGKMRCDKCKYGPVSVDDDYEAETGTPCWKEYQQSEEYECDRYNRSADDLALIDEDFCDACKERERVHEAMVAAARQRGARHAGLRRVVANFEATLMEELE
jgi:hypothetical protein